MSFVVLYTACQQGGSCSKTGRGVLEEMWDVSVSGIEKNYDGSGVFFSYSRDASGRWCYLTNARESWSATRRGIRHSSSGSDTEQ